jgi:hypothetical protein
MSTESLNKEFILGEIEIEKLNKLYPDSGKDFIRKDGLNVQEGKVMDSLVNAWNEFIKLKKQHPCEYDDFADGIHKCQYQLIMRVMRRDYPEGYPKYDCNEKDNKF